jgi:hypothetical protein
MKFFLLIVFFISNQSLFAQIPVYEEPRHKVALRNEYVRLIDVNVPAHDTTLYHRHFIPSVIVFLSKSTTGSQVKGGEIHSGGKVVPGNAVFADFATSPVLHRVWNEDSTVYHVMDIEIFPRDNIADCAVINDSSYKLSFEKKNVRVYNIHIEQGKTSVVQASACPHLLILISGSVQMSGYGKHINPGGFLWYPSGISFKIKNKDQGDAECVLLELK